MPFWPDSYSSKRTVITKDGQSRDLLFQSGCAAFTFKGTGGTWRKDELYILTDASWRSVQSAEAMVSLADISNDKTAVNAGWSASLAGIDVYNGHLLLRVSLGVRDSDGFIRRVAYQCTAVGALA